MTQPFIGTLSLSQAFMARKAQRQFSKGWRGIDQSLNTSKAKWVTSKKEKKNQQVIGTRGNITALHTFQSIVLSRALLERKKKKKRQPKRVRALGPVAIDIHFTKNLQPMPKGPCVHTHSSKDF